MTACPQRSPQRSTELAASCSVALIHARCHRGQTHGADDEGGAVFKGGSGAALTAAEGLCAAAVKQSCSLRAGGTFSTFCCG